MDDSVAGLRFIHCQSEIKPEFWSQLHSLKLEVLRLSEEPVDVVGWLVPGDPAPRLVVDGSSLCPPSTHTTNGHHGNRAVRGQVIVYNTLNGYKGADKGALLRQAAEVVWAGMLGSHVRTHSWARFVLLVHLDVKARRALYWLGVPAIVAEQSPSTFSRPSASSDLAVVHDVLRPRVTRSQQVKVRLAFASSQSGRDWSSGVAVALPMHAEARKGASTAITLRVECCSDRAECSEPGALEQSASYYELHSLADYDLMHGPGIAPSPRGSVFFGQELRSPSSLLPKDEGAVFMLEDGLAAHGPQPAPIGMGAFWQHPLKAQSRTQSEIGSGEVCVGWAARNAITALGLRYAADDEGRVRSASRGDGGFATLRLLLLRPLVATSSSASSMPLNPLCLSGGGSGCTVDGLLLTLRLCLPDAATSDATARVPDASPCLVNDSSVRGLPRAAPSPYFGRFFAPHTRASVFELVCPPSPVKFPAALPAVWVPSGACIPGATLPFFRRFGPWIVELHGAHRGRPVRSDCHGLVHPTLPDLKAVPPLKDGIAGSGAGTAREYPLFDETSTGSIGADAAFTVVPSSPTTTTPEGAANPPPLLPLPHGLTAVGWERSESGALGPRLAHLHQLTDAPGLAAASSDLNLALMRWRMLPELNVPRLAATRVLLLGAGTLGCHIARDLLTWGVHRITLVDSGRVTFGNPVRQPLYEWKDAQAEGGGKLKALAAADALRRIRPGADVLGIVMTVPMPGHPVHPGHEGSVRSDVDRLATLMRQHDVTLLLTDSRESRWLPTLLGAAHGLPVITVGLGFDSLLVVRHGLEGAPAGLPSSAPVRHGLYHRGQPSGPCEASSQGQFSGTCSQDKLPSTREYGTPPTRSMARPGQPQPTWPSSKLGCYFCGDASARAGTGAGSASGRPLDQQCTVVRGGCAPIASALAVELLVALLHHPAGLAAPGPTEEEFASMATSTAAPRHSGSTSMATSSRHSGGSEVLREEHHEEAGSLAPEGGEAGGEGAVPRVSMTTRPDERATAREASDCTQGNGPVGPVRWSFTGEGGAPDAEGVPASCSSLASHDASNPSEAASISDWVDAGADDAGLTPWSSSVPLFTITASDSASADWRQPLLMGNASVDGVLTAGPHVLLAECPLLAPSPQSPLLQPPSATHLPPVSLPFPAAAPVAPISPSLSLPRESAAPSCSAATSRGAALEAEQESPLGLVPHTVRFFLSTYTPLLATVPATHDCSACGQAVVEAFKERGFDFLLDVFKCNDANGVGSL